MTPPLPVSESPATSRHLALFKQPPPAKTTSCAHVCISSRCASVEWNRNLAFCGSFLVNFNLKLRLPPVPQNHSLPVLCTPMFRFSGPTCQRLRLADFNLETTPYDGRNGVGQSFVSYGVAVSLRHRLLACMNCHHLTVFGISPDGTFPLLYTLGSIADNDHSAPLRFFMGRDLPSTFSSSLCFAPPRRPASSSGPQPEADIVPARAHHWHLGPEPENGTTGREPHSGSQPEAQPEGSESHLTTRLSESRDLPLQPPSLTADSDIPPGHGPSAGCASADDHSGWPGHHDDETLLVADSGNGRVQEVDVVRRQYVGNLALSPHGQAEREAGRVWRPSSVVSCTTAIGVGYKVAHSGAGLIKAVELLCPHSRQVPVSPNAFPEAACRNAATYQWEGCIACPSLLVRV